MVLFEAVDMVSALLLAAMSGEVDKLYQLLRENPDVLADVEMLATNTPLHISAAIGHREFVSTLLALKPSFAWDLNKEGFSAINLATANGHIDIVRDLLMHDPILRMLKDKEGRTSLHCAVVHGRINIIDELLMKFDDGLDMLTSRGETVLHLALKHNQEDAFGKLMNSVKRTQRQKLLDLKDKSGNTILELAYAKKMNKAIQLITEMKNLGKRDSKFGIKMVKIKNFMPKDMKTSGLFFFLAFYVLLCTILFFQTTKEEACSDKEFPTVFYFQIDLAGDLANITAIEISRVKEEHQFEHLLWVELDIDKAIQLETEMKNSYKLDEAEIKLPEQKIKNWSFILEVPKLKIERKFSVFHSVFLEASLLMIIFIVLEMIETIDNLTTHSMTNNHSAFPTYSPFIIYLAITFASACFIQDVTQVVQEMASHSLGHFMLYEGKSSITIVVAVAGTLGLHHKMLKTQNEAKQRRRLEHLLQDWGVPCLVMYSQPDLLEITNNFSTEIGRGGFGIVYKGNLQNGVPVAVKKLRGSYSSKEDVILSEVSSIGRIHHKNVVQLLGICLDASVQALIYEYMPSGSLDMLIFRGDRHWELSWNERLNIALGIAAGLEYLHQECNPSIIHGDLKPENILLDFNLSPKLSDFGLSRLLVNKETVAGTLGEFLTSNNLSCKSDIFSFGVMLLEIIGGRKLANFTAAGSESQEFFPNWAYKCLVKGQEFGNEEDQDTKIAKKLATVACWCIQRNPADRPPMPSVLRMLEDETARLNIPPNPFVLLD